MNKTINVIKSSDTELGVMLSPGYPYKFKTIFGKAGNVRNVIDYISIPEYPATLLGKTVLDSRDISLIKKFKKVKIENYHAIIASVLIERVKSDKKIIEMMKEEKYTYVSNFIKKSKLYGKVVEYKAPKHGMKVYCNILTKINELVYNDNLNDTTAWELIESYMENKESLIGDLIEKKENAAQ